MNQLFKLNGTVYWANFFKKNAMSDKYQFDLGNLSDKAVEALEGMGIDVKNNGDEKASFVTVKSSKYPFTVVNEAGDQWDEKVLVGNGTKAAIVANVYEWKFKNKEGKSVGAKKVIIKELVKYELPSLENIPNSEHIGDVLQEL